jgi:hypothetical protein
VNLPLGGGYLYPAAYGNFVAPESVQDCSDIDITANGLPDSNTDGATAHIQGGGEYEEVDACKRISAEDMDAIFTEVTWGDFYSSSADSGSGDGLRPLSLVEEPWTTPGSGARNGKIRCNQGPTTG